MAGVDDSNGFKRIIVPGFLNDNIHAEVLVDTGAVCSVINYDLFCKLNLELLPTEIALEAFDGNISSALGRSIFKFSLENSKHPITVDAMVIQNCNPEFILGLRDINALGFQLISPEGDEFIGKSTLSIKNRNKFPRPHVDVCTVLAADSLLDDVVLLHT